MAKIIVTDTSLRDGSHSVSHQYTVREVGPVAAALDRAGVDIIEVSHGDGIGGASMNYGFSAQDEMDLIEAAAKAVERASIAILLVPGIGTIRDLKEAKARGAKIVRVATHVTEADVSEEYIKAAKDMGFTVVGFLMMAHMADVHVLQRQASMMEGYGADVIYVTDSAGALLPHEVGFRIEALRKVISVPLGLHAHDNLGLAIGNSLEAVRAGATYVDGSLGGLGAGAGNAATEILVAVLRKYGADTNADVFQVMDAASEVMVPLIKAMGKHFPRHDATSLVMGYAGVYSSFMLHARKASERFNVDVRDILVELGRCGAIGGQEDWIIKVAWDLAEAKKTAKPGEGQ